MQPLFSFVRERTRDAFREKEISLRFGSDSGGDDDGRVGWFSVGIITRREISRDRVGNKGCEKGWERRGWKLELKI